MAENNEQPRPRLSRGRQKVAMVKMANESNLQVTFSKRRAGLFKKASELCTLCGAEMALVVFSPGKKVFSFGHPSVEAVLDRYVGIAGDSGISGAGAAAMQLIEAHRSVSLRDLNAQLAQVTAQVDAERKRGELLSRQRREAVAAQRWWEAPVEKIEDEGRIRQLSRALEELRRAVSAQTDRIVIETTTAANAAAAAMANTTPFYGASGGQAVLYNNNNNNNMNSVGPSSSYNGNNNLGYGRGFY